MDSTLFLVENGGNTCYIDSLLMGLFYNPSYLDALLKKKLKKDENSYIQEYISQAFVNKVREGKSVSAEDINNLRVILTQSGWTDWDTIMEQQDVNEFYTFLANVFEINSIELEKKIYLDNNDSTIHKEYMPFIPLSLPKYDKTSLENNKQVKVPDLLREWLHLDEVSLKQENSEKIGLSTYHITNVPEFLVLSINRFNSLNDRNNTDVIITKRLKPFIHSSNPEIKNIEWSFHSAVCHKGNSVLSGHYYSLLFKKYNETDLWYLFDDLTMPSLIEVSMSDTSITSDIKKDCVLLIYQLKFS